MLLIFCQISCHILCSVMPAVVIRQRKAFRRKNGIFIYFEGEFKEVYFHYLVIKQGCHRQWKVREIRKFFKVREGSAKIFDFVKVSEKSGNFVFRFIVHKFSSRFWSVFSFRNAKSILQSKQSNQFDTLCLTHVVAVVSGFHCECFLPNSFLLNRKEVENEEKNIDRLQKKLKRT